MAFVASYYVWCLVTNHPFLDGNKRTAYQVAYVFLLANGYLLRQMNPQDVVTTFNGIATNRISREELTQWMQQHLSQLDFL
jgi:death-on-curing protein